MALRVAINGFGRIGRLVLRAIVESKRTDIVVVGVNDLGPVETNAHLLRYDSVHGRFPGEVKVDGDLMIVDGHKIKVTAIKDPAQLPHRNWASTSRWNARASSPRRKKPRRISQPVQSACSFRRLATVPTAPSSMASTTRR
jgi:hypothetical protein